MITMPQGFKIGSTESIDTRLVVTKAEMLAVKDSTMPQVYMAVCKDDGQMYIYNKANTLDAETGKYRLYAASAGSTTNEAIPFEQIQTLFQKEGE